MADTLSLRGVDNAVVALADSSQLFADIGSLGAQWAVLAAQISKTTADPVTDGTALTQWLLANLDAPGTVAIFDVCGAGALLTRLVAVKAQFDAILSNGASLLSPLSTFKAPTTPPTGVPDEWLDDPTPALVKIAPTAFTASPTLPDDLTVSLSLSAAVGVDASAQWPYTSDAVELDYLLLAAMGAFSANATFRLPFAYGSVGGSVGGALDPEIMYYFHTPDRSKIFAAAVADALIVLPDPFDPASVWRAFSGGLLAGMILVMDGNATASVNLSIGEKAIWPGVLTGDASITVSVGLTRKAAFELSLRAIGTPGNNLAIVARLSRNSSAETDWGLGIGIDIDASPLFTKVHTVLSDALGKVDGVIAEITPYLKPGTFLTAEAGTQIDDLIAKWAGDGTIGAALKQDAALLLGTATNSTGGITEAIQNTITGALDNAGGVAGTDIATAMESVTALLTQALPALGAAGFADTLTTDVTALITTYQKQLEQLANTLLEQSGFQKVEASLASVGVKVAAAANQVDQVLAGLRDLITKYDGILQQIVAAIADSARSKITARISYESAQTSGTQYELSGVFKNMTGPAGALYSALAFGQLSGIQQAFDSPVPGFMIDPDNSSIARLYSKSSTLGYDVVLFGLELSGQDVLQSTAEVTTNARGDITIAAQGSDALTQKQGGATRSLTFSTTYDLMAAKLQADTPDAFAGRPIIKLAVSSTITETPLKRADVSAFLALLQSFGLISPVRTINANKAFDSWTSTRGTNTTFTGTVAVMLNFADADVKSLIAAGQAAGNPDVASSAGLAQFQRAITAMLTTGEMDAQNMDTTTKLFDSTDELAPLRAQYPDLVEYLYNVAIRSDLMQKLTTLATPPGGPKAQPSNPQMVHLLDHMAAARALIVLLAKLAAAYALDLKALGSNLAPAAIAAADGDIAAQASPWLSLGGSFFSSSEPNQQKRTVALILALARLAKGPNPPLTGPSSFDAMFSILMSCTNPKNSNTV